mmetsp:Transcript_6146/g.11501  ORF Transcript_6146/g.11501 Transcript_6146/m.11501 type:complete len:210 (-) Transcript_6146:983-1612(-)
MESSTRARQHLESDHGPCSRPPCQVVPAQSRCLRNAHASSEVYRVHSPSHANTRNSSKQPPPAVVADDDEADDGEEPTRNFTLTSGVATTPNRLNSMSPKERATSMLPFTLPFTTVPPAAKILSRSHTRRGVWSCVSARASAGGGGGGGILLLLLLLLVAVLVATLLHVPVPVGSNDVTAAASPPAPSLPLLLRLLLLPSLPLGCAEGV